MKKLIALFVCLLTLGSSVGTNAQTVYMNLTEPQPLAELGIPFTADNFFFANYSANTIAVYVGKNQVGTVPAFSYRRANNFYVATDTRVEAYTNVVTDKGTKKVKTKCQAVVIHRNDGTIDSGWLFYN